MLVLGYRPEDKRYVSALKYDYIGDAVKSVELGIPPKSGPASDIHYLTELAGGRLYVNSIEAIPAVSLLTHNDDDGAYILDDQGGFLQNALKLRPDPEDVLDEMGIPNSKMLWERFGFVTPVGTKHTSGIGTSYKIPHSEIIVVSEESGAIRGFHKGLIFLSPYEEEIKNSMRRRITLEKEALSYHGHQ
jgi:hypothetical protein